MDRKDKISDNYRQQVDELLDNQSVHNYYYPFSQEELDELWEELSVEMDIDEVWNEISSDLDIVMPLDSGSGIFVKSFAAVLIIMIGMIPVNKTILNSGISRMDILIENKPNEQSPELITAPKSVDTNTGEQAKDGKYEESGISLDKREDIIKLTPAEWNRSDLKPGTPIPVSNEIVSRDLASSAKADSNLVVSTDKNPIEESGIPPALLTDEMEKLEVISKKDFDNLKISSNNSNTRFSLPSNERGKVSAGLITLFKNTWLLNRETLDGLKSESLTTTEIVFYPDLGLSLNYSLNKNWLLQADGFFFSNTGQKYLGYYYGHYSRKEITLRYSTFALSVKYKITGRENFMHHSSINLIAGGYLSVLRYADQEINTDLENIRSQYGKFDLGIRLGGEFELQILDRLSLAPGVVISAGIPNIYKGSNIPGNLERTHNGSAGFQLAFYYHFK